MASEFAISKSTLTNIADAIREKTETETLMTPLQMPSKIRSISGGGSGVQSVEVTQIQSTGTKIATIDVDGTSTDLYAPEQGVADTAIAPVFSTSEYYYPNALVIYEGALYRCIAAHEATAWNAAHFTAVSISDELSAAGYDNDALTQYYHTHGIQKVAFPFRAGTTYVVGDYVVYAGGLYRNLTGVTGSDPSMDTTNWAYMPPARIGLPEGGTAGQIVEQTENGPAWSDDLTDLKSAINDTVSKGGTGEVTPKNLQIINQVYSPNLIDATAIEYGVYVTNTGARGTGNYNTTDYLPVEEGEKYCFTWKYGNNRVGASLRWLSCYNENKEVITGAGSADMISEYPITIAQGVKYVRLAFSNNSNYTLYQFEKGAAPTAYHAYGEVIGNVIDGQYLPDVSMAEIPAFELVDGPNLFNPNDPDYVTGQFLNVNGTLSDYSSTNVTGYVAVKPGDYLVFGYLPSSGVVNTALMRTVACYNANKTALTAKGGYSVNGFAVPTGVSYIRVCWANGSYGTTVQLQKAAPYEVVSPFYQEYEEPHYELKSDYMHATPGKPEHVYLPSDIYVAVGRTIELYNEQVVLDHEKYHFCWVCGKGAAYKRKFSITGQTAGDVNLVLRLYDDQKRLCWVGKCVIHVVAASNPVKKILPIGDSLTNWKSWLQETMLLSANSITFVGTRYSGQSVDSEGNIYPSGQIHSEGRSGWGASNYLSDDTYTFDNRYDGVGTVDGTSNPFWDGEKFSLSHYLTTQTGVATPDAVQILLGTNDLTDGVEGAVDNITEMVTSIRAEYPDLPIFVCNTIFRSNQNGYGSTGNDAYTGGSGAGTWQYDQDTRVMDLMVGLRETLAGVSGVTMIPLASCMDREYNFGQVMTKVNPRSDVEIAMPAESVHPTAAGYYQMADLMYSTYCGVLT